MSSVLKLSRGSSSSSSSSPPFFASRHAPLSRLLTSLLVLVLLGTSLSTASPSGVHAHQLPRALSEDTPVAAAAAARAPAACKAAPGSPNWPSDAAWARLNVSTGGRLLRPAPPGAVCHPGQPTYDAALCPTVQQLWTNQTFHQADPVSSMQEQWNNDTCIPYPGYQCSGQGYPVFVVNASTTEHVKTAVDFAREHNVRLIVKSSGHDYLGRSSAPNSLSIWVHHLKGIQTHDTFTPKGCPCSVRYNTSLTAAGGTQMLDAYEATAAIGQVVVGGGGEGVAIGGYLSGGGHSLLSARHGLAADQVLEVELVTAEGEILTLNECQNTDLFWAVRGGGGSTFGVITSVTMKTFPSPQLVNYSFVIILFDPTNPAFFDMVAYLLSQYPSLGDAGVSGYGYWDPSYPYGPASIAAFEGDFVMQDTQDVGVILDQFQPIFDHINATWPGLFHLEFPQTDAFPSFLDWYHVHFDTSAVGNDTYVGSRLLSKEALTANLTAAAAAYKQFSSITELGTAYLVSGKGVFDAKPPGGGDAVSPAWRTSYVHATTPIIPPWGNLTARAEAIVALNYSVAALRELDPDSGAYMNEADPYEPNWQTTFWGNNYPRLAAIKKAVDPGDVFWCTPCVGNEGWQEVGDLLCRV